jgi:dTDP-4-dehydrorhamnose 3,5-epimerase
MNLPPETQVAPSFVQGDIEGVVCKPVKVYSDQRGWLMEIFREDELDKDLHPAMAYLSETLPGVARGPHEHRYQADYFAFLGPGDFSLYLWDFRSQSPTYGNRMKLSVGESNRAVVIVPPGVVHAYKNTSDSPGWVINLPNQLYGGENRKQAVDEIRHENNPTSPFTLN